MQVFGYKIHLPFYLATPLLFFSIFYIISKITIVSPAEFTTLFFILFVALKPIHTLLIHRIVYDKQKHAFYFERTLWRNRITKESVKKWFVFTGVSAKHGNILHFLVIEKTFGIPFAYSLDNLDKIRRSELETVFSREIGYEKGDYITTKNRWYFGPLWWVGNFWLWTV